MLYIYVYIDIYIHMSISLQYKLRCRAIDLYLCLDLYTKIFNSGYFWWWDYKCLCLLL